MRLSERRAEGASSKKKNQKQSVVKRSEFALFLEFFLTAAMRSLSFSSVFICVYLW
jgi:hypothetical protein